MVVVVYIYICLVCYFAQNMTLSDKMLPFYVLNSPYFAMQFICYRLIVSSTSIAQLI